MAERIPKIVVVGPAYVDMVIKCETYPEPGHVEEGSRFSCIPTGSGVNRAVQAALCGCEVFLLTRVGEDCFGEMIKQNLSRYGVSTDLVYATQAMSTGVLVTMVNGYGENRSCYSPGANKILGSDEVEYAAAEQAISSANVLLIHDAVSRPAIVAAIRTAQIHRTRTILEVTLPSTQRSEIESLDWPMEFYNTDVLVLRFRNLQSIAELGSGGEGDLKFIAAELIAKGATCVVISLDWRGCLLVTRQGTTHLPGIPSEVVDNTGCEDAFSGSLAACYASGDSPERAARFAVAAETLARSRFGLQDALPVKAEIITLLQEQPD